MVSSCCYEATFGNGIQKLERKMTSAKQPSFGTASKRRDWKWRGLAGHFCASDRCVFRLCTDIGIYRVSTVGGYYANPGDTKMTMIGADRHYETMVFRLDEDGGIADYNEVEMLGILHEGDPYKTDMLAETQHESMCLKYARLQ